MTDRTYWQRSHGAWHAKPEVIVGGRVSLCGLRDDGRPVYLSDRVPADGHLCGSCARSIASQTDAR